MKKLVYLFVFLLVISLVSAQVSVTHTGPEQAQAGGTVTFTMWVQNEGNQLYNLNILPDPLANLPSSSFADILISPSRVDLQGAVATPINVTMTLKDDVRTRRNYGTFVTVKALNDPSVEVDHQFTLYALDPKDILSFTASASDAVFPGGTLNVDTIVKNKIFSTVEKVVLSVSSEIFNENRPLTFFPKQERTEQFSFEIPSTSSPKDYQLNLKLYYNDKLVDSDKLVFTVLENSDIKASSEIKSSFLKKTIVITRTNVGNAQAFDAITLELSSFEKLFSSFNQEPDAKLDGRYVWNIVLPPGSTFTLEGEVSYVPLAVALGILVLIGLFALYVATRGLTVQKKILTLRQQRDGTTEVRIMIHITNKTQRMIRNAMIYEFLPRFVHPVMKFGTLKPKSMQKGKGGVRMVWSMDNLAKGEERIISYEVMSKLDVIGRFMLPPAWVKYKDMKGRVSRAKSNNLFVTARVDDLEQLEKMNENK